jgi:hypothetical protein
MPARALVALLLVAGSAQQPATPTVRVLVRYAVSSEDDASNGGRLTLAIAAGETKNVVVWEAACRVSGAAGTALAPSDAEQSWTFQIDLTRGADRRLSARVHYRHHTARPGDAPETSREVRTDGRDELNLESLSARTDCRYDHLHITITADADRDPR